MSFHTIHLDLEIDLKSLLGVASIYVPVFIASRWVFRSGLSGSMVIYRIPRAILNLPGKTAIVAPESAFWSPLLFRYLNNFEINCGKKKIARILMK